MFCVLEKDDKTFSYFTLFASLVRKNELTSVLKIDNDIQKQEIEDHLVRVGKVNDDQEKLRWVQDNGAAFREYLNTIKFAAIVWCSSHECDPDWEDFCKLDDCINSHKVYLDAIHG